MLITCSINLNKLTFSPVTVEWWISSDNRILIRQFIYFHNRLLISPVFLSLDLFIARLCEENFLICFCFCFVINVLLRVSSVRKRETSLKLYQRTLGTQNVWTTKRTFHFSWLQSPTIFFLFVFFTSIAWYQMSICSVADKQKLHKNIWNRCCWIKLIQNVSLSIAYPNIST